MVNLWRMPPLPSVSCAARPSGSSPPKYVRANDSFTTASLVAFWVNIRPRRIGTPSTSKNRGETRLRRIGSKSTPDRCGKAVNITKRVSRSGASSASAMVGLPSSRASSTWRATDSRSFPGVPVGNPSEMVSIPSTRKPGSSVIACAMARVTSAAPASRTVQVAIWIDSNTLRRWNRAGRVAARSSVPSGICTRVA